MNLNQWLCVCIVSLPLKLFLSTWIILILCRFSVSFWEDYGSWKRSTGNFLVSRLLSPAQKISVDQCSLVDLACDERIHWEKYSGLYSARRNYNQSNIIDAEEEAFVVDFAEMWMEVLDPWFWKKSISAKIFYVFQDITLRKYWYYFRLTLKYLL